MDESTLILLGGELKSLDDKGLVGGHLCVWGDPNNTDQTDERDYFTPDTDFGRHIKSGVDLYYFHGLPKVHGKPNPLALKVIGETVEVKPDNKGLWIKGQLDLADAYVAEIHSKGIKSGKMGLSSGAAPHLIDREKQPNGSHRITRWPIVEGSITPTPADKRAKVSAIKSLEALKSEFLGDYAERSVINSAMDRLSMTASVRIGDTLGDSTKSNEEKLAFCRGVMGDLTDLLMRVASAMLQTPGDSAAIKTLVNSFDPGASPESFVDTCLRTASELEQAGRRFAKLGATKVQAIKTVRAALDGLLKGQEPRVAPEVIAESRRKVDDLLKRLGDT